VSKAFDCIEHKLLLDRLYTSGINGSPLDLIKSFLTNRTQVQIIHTVDNNQINYYSTPFPAKFGVPLTFCSVPDKEKYVYL
jgi:hypothetical protein